MTVKVDRGMSRLQVKANNLTVVRYYQLNIMIFSKDHSKDRKLSLRPSALRPCIIKCLNEGTVDTALSPFSNLFLRKRDMARGGNPEYEKIWEI